MTYLPSSVMPLTNTKAGDAVRLVSVRAGRGLQGHLASMGLIPGMELTIIKNSDCGPFIVGVNNTRLALGRGMTDKIFVQ